MSELLATNVLLTKSHINPDENALNPEPQTGEEALKDKVVAIYFSAAWCPPCQQFTPLLSELFVEVQNRGLPFQVVFVSLDHNQEEMETYFTKKHGDWLVLPFDDPVKDDLISKYDIHSIPKLVVIRANGDVVTMKGRKDVQDKGIVCFRNWHSLSNLQETIAKHKQTAEQTPEQE